MNQFEMTERVELEEGELVRIVTAHAKDCIMDVAKIYESGKCLMRNISPTPLNGWCIEIPGQHYRGNAWNGPYIGRLDPWWEYNGQHDGLSYNMPSEHDKSVILAKYPDFKWVMKKSSLTVCKIFKALPIWKKNPSAFEALISQGWDVLAFNKNTYKAKDKREILEFIRSHADEKYMTLNDIRVCIKNSIEPDQLRMWKFDNRSSRWTGYLTYPEWKWLDGRSRSMYRDYKQMAKECGHDLKDPYWHYPKDLRKAHDKVMKEVANVRALKQVKEMKAKQEEYIRVVKNLLSKKLESRGCTVYVPDCVETIARQAEILHQCLVRCDYIGKVIQKKIVLVFVAYKGEPLATAELLRKGKKFKLGQFYGDEQKADCKAPRRAKTALNKWIETYNIKLVA